MLVLINGKRVDLSLEEVVAMGLEPVEPGPVDTFIPVSLMRQRIEALGMLEAFSSYLAQSPAEMMKLLTLEGGRVDPAYPAIKDAFDAMEVPEAARAIILAPESAGVGVP